MPCCREQAAEQLPARSIQIHEEPGLARRTRWHYSTLIALVFSCGGCLAEFTLRGTRFLLRFRGRRPGGRGPAREVRRHHYSER